MCETRLLTSTNCFYSEVRYIEFLTLEVLEKRSNFEAVIITNRMTMLVTTKNKNAK